MNDYLLTTDINKVILSSFSSCLISIKEDGRYILMDADASFLEKCNLESDCIGSCVSSVPLFNNGLLPYLKYLYNKYNSYEIALRPRHGSFSIELSQPATFSLPLSIVLFMRDKVPTFQCVCTHDQKLPIHSAHLDNFCFCYLRKNRILTATPAFYNFMESFGIDIEYVLSLTMVHTSIREHIPVTKMHTMSASSGKLHNFFFTVIPGNDLFSDCAFIYISKINVTDKMTAVTNLTARENQVVRLAAKGLTNRGIASELKISEGSVKKLLSNSYVKLGIEGRMQIYNLF